MYDLIIIGAGPAGLSAAIYASRARLSAIVIEQNFVNGGQIIDTYEIDNYPGLPGISGMDLAAKMAEHAEKLGVETVYGFVQSLDLDGPVKKVVTDDGTYEAKAVIIASGATHMKLFRRIAKSSDKRILQTRSETLDIGTLVEIVHDAVELVARAIQGSKAPDLIVVYQP